jgi:hypothetical protein
MSPPDPRQEFQEGNRIGWDAVKIADVACGINA